jgi:CBS domain-containing protein
MARLTEILRRRPPVVNVVSPDQTVGEAARLMADREVGAVLLVEAGSVVGIFSERDLLRRVVAKGASLADTPLRTVMTPDPIAASPDDDRLAAVLKMRKVGCRHLPILRDGTLVDTISIRDLVFDEIAERTREVEDLKRYIQG